MVAGLWPILDTALGHGYGPRDFEGASGILPAREQVAAMARDANRPGRGTKGDPREAELSDRPHRLGQRLDSEKAQARDREGSAGRGTDQGADPGGIGKAMRLSSEFVAGVIAGALLGWLVDRMLGTSPWGLI